MCIVYTIVENLAFPIWKPLEPRRRGVSGDANRASAPYNYLRARVHTAVPLTLRCVCVFFSFPLYRGRGNVQGNDIFYERRKNFIFIDITRARAHACGGYYNYGRETHDGRDRLFFLFFSFFYDRHRFARIRW